MQTALRHVLLLLSLPALLLACDAETAVPADPPSTEGEGEELAVGDIEDLKSDGVWTHAVQCKPIPTLEPLTDPAITVSLDGLTLHLVDRAGDYDEIFPIGPGSISGDESLTPVSTGAPGGVFWARADRAATQDGPTPAERRWGWNESCRVWWRSESGQDVPVFAGLPFIRLEGPPSAGYGLHGPIDNYTMSSGGTLRRGYVSHGCVRMQAEDIVEVYALIQGHRTPVRIQKAIERRDDDRAVDVEDRWFQSECREDADCTYPGGACKHNPYSGRGFCTQACSRYCPDKAGYPTSFCVVDPDSTSQGMCVLRPASIWNGCARFEGVQEQPSEPRFSQSWVKRSACVPGTPGWIGDRCQTDADCVETDACLPVDGGPDGICTEPCARYCPDLAGHAATFCIAAPDDAGLSEGICAARCTSSDDCPRGATCETEPRYSMTWVVRNVCVPY